MIPNHEAERSIFYHSMTAFALVIIGTIALIAIFTTIMAQQLGPRI